MAVQRPSLSVREQQIPIFWDEVKPQIGIQPKSSAYRTDRSRYRASWVILVWLTQGIQALSRILSASFSEWRAYSWGCRSLDPKPVDHGRSFQELGFRTDHPVSGTQAFSLKVWLGTAGGSKRFRFGFKCHLHPVDNQNERLTPKSFNNTLIQGYNLP